MPQTQPKSPKQKLSPKDRRVVVHMPDSVWQVLRLVIRQQKRERGLRRAQVLQQLIADVLEANPRYSVPREAEPRQATLDWLEQQAADAPGLRPRKRILRRLRRAQFRRDNHEALLASMRLEQAALAQQG